MNKPSYPFADLLRDARERIDAAGAAGDQINSAMSYGMATVLGYFLAGGVTGDAAHAAVADLQNYAAERRAAIRREQAAAAPGVA